MNGVSAGTYSVTDEVKDNLDGVTTSTTVAFAVGATPPPSAASSIYYVYNDQINTPRAITNSAGNLVWTWESDPFGATVPNENPANQGAFAFNLRFPGQYFDKETGLHYNYFRDYNPATGRYVQSDPIGLRGGINTYGYVEGNPILYSDPRGLRGGVTITGVRGPATVLVTNSTSEGLWNNFGNAPNYAPDIPGGFSGINFPWAMPDLKRICIAGYYGSSPNISMPVSDNSNGSCKPAKPPEKDSAGTPGGSGSGNFTCTQWQLMGQ